MGFRCLTWYFHSGTRVFLCNIWKNIPSKEKQNSNTPPSIENHSLFPPQLKRHIGLFLYLEMIFSQDMSKQKQQDICNESFPQARSWRCLQARISRWKSQSQTSRLLSSSRNPRMTSWYWWWLKFCTSWVGNLSHYVQDFIYTSQVVSRISSINSSSGDEISGMGGDDKLAVLDDRMELPSLKLAANAPYQEARSRKETSIHFQVRTVSFREGNIKNIRVMFACAYGYKYRWGEAFSVWGGWDSLGM